MNALFKCVADTTTCTCNNGCQGYNISQPSAPIATELEETKQDIDRGLTGDGDGGGALGGLGFDPVSAVKAAAAYKAVKASGADLIVAPRYEVSEENYFVFKKVAVTVKGNKGNIRSIR